MLNYPREKSEEPVDLPNSLDRRGDKPRIYRKEVCRHYLKTVRERSKTKEGLGVAVGKLPNHMRRNNKRIHKPLDAYKVAPLDRCQRKYLLATQSLYGRRREMHEARKNRLDHRMGGHPPTPREAHRHSTQPGQIGRAGTLLPENALRDCPAGLSKAWTKWADRESLENLRKTAAFTFQQTLGKTHAVCCGSFRTYPTFRAQMQ